MENDVNGTLSELKNGTLTKEEYSIRMAQFESVGKLCDFSTGIVDLAKEVTRSNSKSTEVLGSLTTQLSAIIADKTIDNSEKIYAKKLLDRIFDEIVAQRQADRSDRSWLVKSLCVVAAAAATIIAGGTLYNRSKK